MFDNLIKVSQMSNDFFTTFYDVSEHFGTLLYFTLPITVCKRGC